MRGAFCCVAWARALAVAGALGATSALAQPLPQLEAWAEQAALPVQIADLEAQVAAARLESARAQQGARLALGAALAHSQEPVTETALRRYDRLSGTASLRWPLLGAAESRERDVSDAEALVQSTSWRRQQVLDELRTELRLTYAEAWRAARREQLARGFLSLQPQAEALLRARTDAGLLLEADRRAFVSMFETARRDLERATAARSDAVVALQRLTRRELAGFEPQAPAWSTACLTDALARARADDRPAVVAAAAQVQARQRQLAATRWAGIDAGVSLSQSLSQDVGGQAGHATQVAVDINVPLAWTRWRDSQKAELQLRHQRAELEWQQRRDEAVADLQRARAALAVRESDLRSAQQRLDAALEGDRIARLRASALDGDVLERALQARWGVYTAAVEVNEAWLRLERAQAEASVHGSNCATSETVIDFASDLLPALADPLPAAVVTAPVAPVAWFVWNADTVIGAPPFALPPSAPGARLLLSWRADELERLRSDAGATQRLQRALAQLKGQGWKVDLLLGEPTFVRPQGRAALQRLLDLTAPFDFDGLNLDLERSQLPRSQQASWWSDTLATLRWLTARTTRPVTLTSHYREFERSGVAEALLATGVRSAMAMVYIADVGRAAEVASRALAASPGLSLTIVQSAERELSPSESTFTAGRRASLARWQLLDAQLRGWPNFAGIAVQSLQAFMEMKP